MPTYPFPTPIPTIADGYYARVFGNAGGVTITNDFALLRSTDADAASAHDVASLVGNAFASHLAPRLASAYSGDFCGVYDLSLSSSTMVEVPFTVAGGVTSSSTPISVAALYRHDVGIRHKVGHTYLAPFPTTNQSADYNHINTLYMADWQDAMDSFVTAITATGGVWGAGTARFCVLSKITAKAWDPALLPVSSSTIRSKLSSQRRRNNE